jgi:hypothetical protein
LARRYVFDPERLAAYYGNGHDELHLAFNFLAPLGLQAEPIRAVLAASSLLDRVGAYPAWSGSNHDADQLASRWAERDSARIRCALMLLLTLGGTAVLYVGDEIGLPDMPIGPVDAVAGDCATRWIHHAVCPWLPVGRPPSTVDEERTASGSTLHLCRDLDAQSVVFTFERMLSNPSFQHASAFIDMATKMTAIGTLSRTCILVSSARLSARSASRSPGRSGGSVRAPQV